MLHSGYPKELKTRFIEKPAQGCLQQLYSQLFAKAWKHPRDPSVGKWINCRPSQQ